MIRVSGLTFCATAGLLSAGILSGLNLVSSAQADPKVGRHSDGRPYRVDSQGYQLTDQIAELEVTIQEQQNQLTSCEDRLDKAQKGLPAPRTGISDVTCQAAPVTATSCREFTAPILGRVSLLENELASKQPAACDFNSRTAPLEAKIKTLQASLDESTDSADERLAQASKSIDSTKSQIGKVADDNERLTAALEKKSQKEQELLAKVDSLSRQLENALTKTNTSSTVASRAMLTKPEIEETDFDSETLVSLEMRKRIQSELSVIQSLVTKRKDLYDSVRGARKGVSIQLQPLKTSNQLTLDQLRSTARLNYSGSQAAALVRGLGEIRDVLEGDIQVMNRVIKRL